MPHSAYGGNTLSTSIFFYVLHKSRGACVSLRGRKFLTTPAHYSPLSPICSSYTIPLILGNVYDFFHGPVISKTKWYDRYEIGLRGPEK